MINIRCCCQRRCCPHTLLLPISLHTYVHMSTTDAQSHPALPSKPPAAAAAAVTQQNLPVITTLLPPDGCRRMHPLLQFGGGQWESLHYISHWYPVVPTEEEKAHARAYVASIAALYPCVVCRAHFAGLVRANPPNVDSRDAFSRWTVDAHNIVNAMCQKPLVTHAAAAAYYRDAPVCEEKQQQPEGLLASARIITQASPYMVPLAIITALGGAFMAYLASRSNRSRRKLRSTNNNTTTSSPPSPPPPPPPRRLSRSTSRQRVVTTM